MMLIVAVSLLGLLVLFLIVVACRPAAFTVRRSQQIAAPPERAFAAVADLRAWQAWSPWEGIDPAMRRTYSAASTGVGASYHWAGDRRIGEGEMTIAELRPAERVGFDLAFLRPFRARNQVVFEFAARDGGTLVTWSMSGRNSFLFKLMGLFMDCDAMIGRQFEQGLAKLKGVCETSA